MQLGSMRTKKFGYRVVAIVALGIWGLSRPLPGQVATADIVGTVTDPNGGVLANVKVTAQKIDTQLTRTAKTDSSGSFDITLLPVGRYRVTAEATGFKIATVSEIALDRGTDRDSTFAWNSVSFNNRLKWRRKHQPYKPRHPAWALYSVRNRSRIFR